MSLPLSLPGYIDSSMLSTWRSCRRKFFWSYLNSLYPSGKSVHLIAGGAFAAGMEAARRLAFERSGDHRPLHDDLLQAAYQAFVREWGDYEAPEDSPKSFVNTFSALEYYLRQCPPETDVVQPLIRPNGTPTVEFTFSIPLDEAPPHPETGDPFLFVGRFDLLGTYGGLNAIVDEKTTSGIGFSWASQWALRGQFMGYLWACQQLGYEVDTAIIRGISIVKASDPKIATAIEQFPRHLIDRWYQMLLKDVRAINHAWIMQADFPENHEESFPFNFADACSSYGGCAFTTLCAAKEAEPFFTNYIRHRFDPLSKQPVKELADA